MKLEGERWRALVSTVRLGREEYRVVQPARPLPHAPLYEGYLGVEASVDKASARHRHGVGVRDAVATDVGVFAVAAE